MIGIDRKIDLLATYLKTKLFVGKLYTANGRAFINVRDGRKIPEILSSGNEYQEVKLDDRLDVQSFCIVLDDYKVNNEYIDAKVDIYFKVNLKVCYPTITERAIEYAHRDVLHALRYSEFNANGITQNWGIFEDTFDNMSPDYLFKVSTNVGCMVGEC